MSTNDDDAVFGNEGVVIERCSIAAVVSCFIVMRVVNIKASLTIFKRKNFPSDYQWYSVLLLHIFSMSTGFFTLAFVSINLWCLIQGGCPKLSLRLFYMCYALQNLNYNCWLISRDRALQSQFVRTNKYFIYFVMFLSVVSFFCNMTLMPSMGSELQMLGQLIQILVIAIMTIIFVAPLMKNHKLSQQSPILRDVVLRTAIGSAIHVSATCLFVSLLFEGTKFQSWFGVVGYDGALFVTTTFPTLFHIALSHRDDKPLLFLLKYVHGVCSMFVHQDKRRVMTPINGTSSYRSVVCETFDMENQEVRRLGYQPDSLIPTTSYDVRNKHVLSDPPVYNGDDLYEGTVGTSYQSDPISPYKNTNSLNGSLLNSTAAREDIEESQNFWGRW